MQSLCGFDKIELLGGAVRFTPFWFFLDCVAFIHFFGSWFYSIRKTGWKIDFFYLTLLQSFVVPVLCIYPFNASMQNTFAITKNPFLQADPYIDQAFAIIFFGYVGVWVGIYLTYVAEIKRFCHRFFTLFRPLEHCIVKNILSKKCIYSLFFICLVFTLLITVLSNLNHFFLRPRVFFQMNEKIRPIYNFTISLAPMLLLFLSARYLQLREKWCKFFLIITCLMSVCYGIRSVLIHSLLFYCTSSIFKNKGQLKVLRGCIILFILIFLALELEKIREGIPIFHSSFGIFSSLVYGNHFSDTRDFAWVLANWDHEYLLGLGYLANIFSFIPSAFLPFRQEYSLANYTSNLICLDLSIHNGVRSGFFGQVFFNFGLTGVFLSGLICGMTLQFSNQKFKESILENDNIIEAYSKTVPYFCVTSILFSHMYWIFYVFILINVALSLLRRFRACR